MKKLSLAFLATSVIAASGSAFAATDAGHGQINFTGMINNDACSVEGAAGKDKSVSVPMGTVSIKDMGSDTAPTGGRLAAADFNLKINCNEGTKVAMLFDAKSGSGVVAGKKVLALNPGTESAKNVGIAIMDSNGQIVDLSAPATAKIESELNGADATLTFSAAYVTTADPKSATAGKGDATLPFTLQYE
ncbi:fimbrial protein [Pseudomonas sp. JS3066]|jgi:major type 1 subunit fimbrin (pilin)|uniref:fimbrial protein n=1 Tax=unclassified Pseudomonas TaxID=196821 RepID=UPI000EAA5824|nr:MULTISPECIES: fimbrial protein [unclassified Pseudomonas]AYF88952.1 type 1 fimbrial protein [Pseudomonas sp. DY-1]MDH4653157.1 type 1 fimbrial protein [Pseudomonas sp. BN606]MRK19745.1 type 1 fimbrial protein [Pseudomonas sp. JG-B]WVK93508.1 fimbrial protein [Pseudomonas sp. JS3066]